MKISNALLSTYAFLILTATTDPGKDSVNFSTLASIVLNITLLGDSECYDWKIYTFSVDRKGKKRRQINSLYIEVEEKRGERRKNKKRSKEETGISAEGCGTAAGYPGDNPASLWRI